MSELLTGLAAGTAGLWGLSRGLARFGRDPARPPQLYEYSLDNLWFKTTDLEHQEINEPLRGSHEADVVIIGGGFTGLSSAYDLRREFPDKKIVVRVTPGRVHRIETELGEINAPTLVLGLNGYSHKLGFFRNRLLPLCSYVIATEPLSKAQWKSVGWQNRQGLSDQRVLFTYQRPTADGRIVIGGADYPYYANDALSSGNNKPVIELLRKDLFDTFPQLEGLRVDHAWGGTMGFTLDFVPSVGVMGEHENIYYGVAYNGHGVVFGQTAGRLITELMARETSELTDLFVVNHKIPYAGPSSLRIVFARLYKEYLKRWGSNTTR